MEENALLPAARTELLGYILIRTLGTYFTNIIRQASILTCAYLTKSKLGSQSVKV